jgi:2-methylcitrate dehydratase PrpD
MSQGGCITADETVLASTHQTFASPTLPKDVVQRAKDCIIDTVAAISQGSSLPWSCIVVRHTQRIGAGDARPILGADGPTVHAPAAALANGTLAQAFELDSARRAGKFPKKHQSDRHRA